MEDQGFSPKRVVAGGLFALFLALIVAALTVFGFINMILGHLFLILAFGVGVWIICSEILPAKPPRHKAVFCLLLLAVIGAGDYTIVRHKKPDEVNPAITRGPHITLTDFVVDGAGLDVLSVHTIVENMGDATATGLMSTGSCKVATLSRNSEDKLFEILRRRASTISNTTKTRDLEPGPQYRFMEQVPCPMPSENDKGAMVQRTGVWYFVLLDAYNDIHGVRKFAEHCEYIQSSDPKTDNMLFHICGSHNQTVTGTPPITAMAPVSPPAPAINSDQLAAATAKQSKDQGAKPQPSNGFVQFEEKQLLAENKLWVDNWNTGKILRMNFFVADRGTRPVRDVETWGMFAVLDLPHNPGVRLQRLYLKAIEQAYTRSKGAGNGLGVNAQAWNTAVSQQLTQKQIDGIQSGGLSIHLVTGGAWTDEEGRKHYLTHCEWTNWGQVPFSQAIWHDC